MAHLYSEKLAETASKESCYQYVKNIEDAVADAENYQAIIDAGKLWDDPIF